MNLLKIFLAAGMFLSYTLAHCQLTLSGELRKWHTIVLTVTGPETNENAEVNPFMDHRLNIRFTSPTQRTYIVPGFYAADGNAAETGADSGNKWRVRFTPDEIGEWTYEVSFRTGNQIAVSEDPQEGEALPSDGFQGSVRIENSDRAIPDNRAKGRLEYVGSRYLRFAESGDYFIKAGADSPENLLAYSDFDNTVAKKSWEAHLQDWENGNPVWQGSKGKGLIGALNYLASKGMNAFSFLTMNIVGDGKDVWPWAAEQHQDLDGSSTVEKENRTRYDVSKLEQWEVLFSHADSLGLFLHFKTQETENDQLLDEGELGPQRKLYYRELIARFGHHLALNWNLGEEFDLYEELQDPDNTRAKSFAGYFRKVDPYKHHVVIHSYPDKQSELYPSLLGDTAISGASVQSHIDSIHNDIKQWVTLSEASGHPWAVANDEQGDAGTGVTADAAYQGNRGNKPDNRDDVRNKVLWGTLLAGGYGVEYYFGYQTGETDLTGQDWRSRELKWDDAKIALDFFRDELPFWEMSSQDELISGAGTYCLANPGETYVVYLAGGGESGLDLSGVTGNFSVSWFNPREGGALIKSSLAEIPGGGEVSLGLPPTTSVGDWVALVQKIGTTGEIFPVDSVEISPRSLQLTKGGSFQLSYITYPESASDIPVNWVSSTPETAIIDSTGVITAKAAGETLVSIQVAGDSISDSIRVTVLPEVPWTPLPDPELVPETIPIPANVPFLKSGEERYNVTHTAQPLAGTGELFLQIVPNPSPRTEAVQLVNLNPGVYELGVFNLQGQLVSSRRIEVRSDYIYQLNLKTPGLFLVRVDGPGGNYAGRLLVK